jgi:NDP-sugar pyrophosphorylase family protein
MNVVLLLAGGNDAFHEAGSPYPKNLVEVAGQPLVQLVLERLLPLKSRGARFISMIPGLENRRFHTASVIRLIEPASVVVEVPETTAGAACTALLAVEQIDNDDPLLVVNGDILLDVDPSEVIGGFERRGLDAGIVVFEAVHPRWSFVRLDEAGWVVEAAEKRPISQLAATGFYWFARGSDFVGAAAQVLRKGAAVDGKYYVTPVLNELILDQKRIGVHLIEKTDYHSLKDPTGVRQFEQSHPGQATRLS